MSALNLPFAYPWEVRTPIVDRTIERQYVDGFFKDGSLRLSSFESFRKHPNEERRDEEEGRAVMKIASPSINVSALASSGQEGYILCASMIETNPKPGYGVFRIKDTLAFAAAVARQLPGFVGGTEGPCIYRANTIYEAADGFDFTMPEGGPGIERWFQESKAVMARHMTNKFFIKPAKFSAEAEYRMLWFCEGTPRPHIDIKCPMAIQFCEQVGTERTT